MPFPMNIPGAGGIGPEVLMQLMELLRKRGGGGDPQSATRPGEIPTSMNQRFPGSAPGPLPGEIPTPGAGRQMLDPSSAVRPGEMGGSAMDEDIAAPGQAGAGGGGMPPELMQLMSRLGIGG